LRGQSPAFALPSLRGRIRFFDAEPVPAWHASRGIHPGGFTPWCGGRARLDSLLPPLTAMSGPQDAEKLKIVLLYEPRFVKKAMVTYACLARELAADFTTDLRVWRLEIAIAEGFADRVARDLEAAEVILIAVRGDQPCPAAFQRWRGKSGAPRGAIIALTEVADDVAPSAGTWNSVLRVAATQIHPEIYVWDPLPTDDSISVDVEYPATEETVMAGKQN